MSINCGIQCLVCDYPIHMDTYKGCSHGCVYCFVKQKYSIDNVEPISTTKSLRNHISGKRNKETKWCDWDIPIHWGANSDPFQPCEKEHKKSLECLRIFAESKYPFIVSTKNPKMLTEEPYLSLMKQCRCVLQVSMACSKYDKIEHGAPSYEDRLKAVAYLADKVTRIVARVRPFFPDCQDEILAEIPRYADAGIYGISIASFVTTKKHNQMQRFGTKYMFPTELIAPLFREIKEKCHENGLKFFCSEPDLDHWSDDLACCGTMGLPDFKPNKYNVPHLAYDEHPVEPTEAMMQINTYQPFKCLKQNQTWAEYCKNRSFADLMQDVGGERINRCKKTMKEWGE